MNYSKQVLFQPDKLEYDVRMKKRRNWWWLLLLLLLPLLLLKCTQDLEVYCVDQELDNPVSDALVILSYHEHNFYKEGQFFVTDTINLSETTDSVGLATFHDLTFHVYDYVFYWLGKGILDVDPECYGLAEAEQLHVPYHRKVTLDLQAATVRLPIKVIDLETDEEIPGAKISYECSWTDAAHDTLTTDPTGQANIESMRYCYDLKSISCTAYGYADTIVQQIAVRPIADSASPLIIKVRPIKASFTFTVLNSISHEPIPQAQVEVKLQSRGGTSDTGSAMTNVDGLGKGFHANGAILSSLDLLASKPHYRPGQFNWEPYPLPHDVDHFRNLPDSQRVIYLEPEPFVVEFLILDSLTHKPVSGVTNDITITHLDGTQETIPAEVSNRNGVIPIEAREGEIIDIISKKVPEYITKRSHIQPFVGPDTIYISPNYQSLTFRTIIKGTNSLLPNCGLSVKTQNGTRQDFPKNSGTGTFTVSNVLPDDKLFIAARKGSKSNGSSINGQSVRQLMNAAQKDRDIPLEVSYDFSSSNAGMSSQNYDMGPGPYNFSISWNLCSGCTILTLKDGNNVIATLGYLGQTNTSASGTMIFRSNSPTLVVLVKNDNGHDCKYTITRL